MSSTNTTPNYGLPQYIPTDKPTYLGDFNKAMLDIDTNMKTIENKAVSAESSVATANATADQALENANTASTKADTAQATATQAQATATQAKTSAESAQATATQAQTSATQAQNDATKALSDLSKFNLTNSQKISNVTAGTNTSNVIDCNLTLMTDSTNKIFKLYGKVTVKPNSKGYAEVSFQSNLRPSTNVTMQGCGFSYDLDTGGILSDSQIKIETTGKVIIRANCAKNTYGTGIWLLNMLYFLETFDQSIVPDMN